MNKIDLLRKLLLGTTAAGTTSLTDPTEAEAVPMLPEIRKLFMQKLINNPKEVPRLFHGTSSPDGLVEAGLTQEMFPQLENYKPKGLYFTEEPRKIPGHLSADYSNTDNLLADNKKVKSRFRNYLETGQRSGTDVVRGTLEPDTKIATVTREELKEYRNRYNRIQDVIQPSKRPSFDEYLRGILDADVVKKVNVDQQQGLNEWIVMNPEKLNMFYKNKALLNNRELIEKPIKPKGVGVSDTIYKFDLPLPEGDAYSEDEITKLVAKIKAKGITSESMNPSKEDWKIGLTGAVLGGTAASLMPNKAEAMPIGKLKKLNPKQLEDAIRQSSVYNKIVGQTIPLKGADKVSQDYKIVDVLKNPKNDWRYLIVQDAEGNRKQLPMTKDYVEVLAGSIGTKKYIKKFETQGPVGQEQQADISLAIRELKRANTSDVSKTNFRSWNSMQKAKADKIDPALVNDYNYVRLEDGTTLYMPKEYAELLASQGKLKILKR